MDQDERQWGNFRVIDRGPAFTVKRLTVKPGGRLSLQHHLHRSEHWTVAQGTAEVTRNDEIFRLSLGESCDIPLGARHRLANPGDEDLIIIEVWFGAETSEDDIVRHPD